MNDVSETNERRFSLANDTNGNPIDLPPEAVAWRVRKLARKAGRPKMIYDAETGRPLELPLAISFADFAESVNEAGRYRLEAVDGQGRLLVGCIAIAEVIFDDDDDDDDAAEETAAAKRSAPPELLQLISQLVDTNARVMQAMASAFGQVHPSTPQPIVVPPSVVPAVERSSWMNNPMVTGMLEQIAMMFLKPNIPTGAMPNTPTPTPSS
jgi:hypothetical protein